MRFAAERDGKVVLDRLEEISRRGAQCEAAGEFVEVLDFKLAPLKSIDLFLQPGGKIAGDKRDQQEQRHFEDLVRVADHKAVKRRYESSVRRRQADTAQSAPTRA
jgi:hypothetical protein